MTAPISVDYPDWQRVASRAVKIFANENNTNLGSAVLLGPYFVGDIPYIAYIFDTVSVAATFSAYYYLDRTLGTDLGNQNVDVPIDGGFDFSLPVQGPWVQFVITPVGGVGTFDLKAFEAAGPLVNLRGNATNNILAATNSNIAAGASLTVASTRVMQGEAHWFCESAAATWTARVEAVTAGGVATIIDELRKTAAGDGGRQIFLPPAPCQLVITNQTAGLASFRGALVARPLEAGR